MKICENPNAHIEQENLAIMENRGTMGSEDVSEVSMDDILTNPRKLGERTPAEWYETFRENGNEPRPLGDGSLKGVAFEDGGGYRVNWDSNKVFLYHPESRSHHGGAYYKLSDGTSKKRYNLLGLPLRKEGA